MYATKPGDPREWELRVAETIKQKEEALGLAIIIGNQYSPGLHVLKGPPEDVKGMCVALESVHYATVTVNNASKEDILGIVQAVKKQFPRDPKPGCYQRFVFAFAGHGDISDSLHCHDAPVCLRTEVIWPLLPVECEDLQYITKMFFIDACRMRRDPTPSIASRGGRSVPPMANYYLAQSTLPQQEALEQETGGFWMQLLATELCNRGNKGRNIQSIVSKVSEQLNEVLLAEKKANGFLQQPMDGGTLHGDVMFIDEAIAFEEMHLTAVGCAMGTNSGMIIDVPPQTCHSAPQALSVKSIDLISTGRGREKCSPKEALKQLLERLEECPRIEYTCKGDRGRYKATVLAPVIGYTEGSLCSSPEKAKNSAARAALAILDQDCI